MPRNVYNTLVQNASEDQWSKWIPLKCLQEPGVAMRNWNSSGDFSPYCSICQKWSTEQHIESDFHKKRSKQFVPEQVVTAAEAEEIIESLQAEELEEDATLPEGWRSVKNSDYVPGDGDRPFYYYKVHSDGRRVQGSDKETTTWTKPTASSAVPSMV